MRMVEDPGWLMNVKNFMDPGDHLAMYQVIGQIIMLMVIYWLFSIAFLRFHCWYQEKTPEDMSFGFQCKPVRSEPPSFWTFFWPLGVAIYSVYFIIFGPSMIVQKGINANSKPNKG